VSASPSTDLGRAPGRPRHHLVITGVGRSGSTFLVELLTRLGLDTGFEPETVRQHVEPRSRAGLERDIRDDDAPYVVKSPKFIECAAEVLRDDRVVVDRAILLVRELDRAAESRRRVDALAQRELSPWARLRHARTPLAVPGGIWGAPTRGREAQESALGARLATLLLELADSHVPLTLVRFPRMVRDPEYLYAKVGPLARDLPFRQFCAAFRDTARPDLVSF